MASLRQSRKWMRSPLIGERNRGSMDLSIVCQIMFYEVNGQQKRQLSPTLSGIPDVQACHMFCFMVTGTDIIAVYLDSEMSHLNPLSTEVLCV